MRRRRKRAYSTLSNTNSNEVQGNAPGNVIVIMVGSVRPKVRGVVKGEGALKMRK